MYSLSAMVLETISKSGLVASSDINLLKHNNIIIGIVTSTQEEFFSYHIFYGTYELVMKEQVLGFILRIWSSVKHSTNITGNSTKSLLSCILLKKRKKKKLFVISKYSKQTSTELPPNKIRLL